MFGMNAILNASVIHQKSQDMRSILDNLSFILEDMGRNIRTGYNYRCIDTESLPVASLSNPKSCASGWGIAFEPAAGLTADDNDQWVYFIAIDNSVNPPVYRIWKSTAGPASLSNFFQLTPPEVAIDPSPSVSGFSVLGAERPSGNTQQPLVTIRLSGKITSRNNIVTPFALQTSVSQRLIDILP